MLASKWSFEGGFELYGCSKKIARAALCGAHGSGKKARIERLAIAAAARKGDAPHAMREYRAAEEASLQKTARLRAERLDREARGILPEINSDGVRVAKRRSI